MMCKKRGEQSRGTLRCIECYEGGKHISWAAGGERVLCCSGPVLPHTTARHHSCIALSAFLNQGSVAIWSKVVRFRGSTCSRPAKNCLPSPERFFA